MTARCQGLRIPERERKKGDVPREGRRAVSFSLCSSSCDFPRRKMGALRVRKAFEKLTGKAVWPSVGRLHFTLSPSPASAGPLRVSAKAAGGLGEDLSADEDGGQVHPLGHPCLFGWAPGQDTHRLANGAGHLAVAEEGRPGAPSSSQGRIPCRAIPSQARAGNAALTAPGLPSVDTPLIIPH